MENASKALLIAGAILIVILLIAIGVLLYTNSKEVIDTSTGKVSEIGNSVNKIDLEGTIDDVVKDTDIKTKGSGSGSGSGSGEG